MERSGGGPRESPEKGFRSYPADEEGPKLRIRSETFADHYSQARQFYVSQTEVEQNHIADALIFELSKVERLEIRARMVSHLLNIHTDLAKQVADGLRLKEMPKPADAAKPTRKDLKKSPALSILLNGPESFKGRKVGALVTDGVDIDILKALKAALKGRRAAGNRRAESRRRRGQRRYLDRSRAEDRWRTFRALRCRGPIAVGGRRQCWRKSRPRVILSPTLSPT